MAYDLEHRVGILEATVRSEAEQRAKMSQDIGKLGEKADAHFHAQRLLIQALQETQSDHTEALRDIRGKVDWMVPKVDLIETSIAGVSTRMGILEGKVDQLEGKFVHLEGKFDQLEGRFVHLEGRFDQLEGRFVRLEGKVDHLDGKFVHLEGKVDHLDGKIDAVNQRLDDKFGQLDGKIDAVKLELTGKMDAVIDMLRNGR